MSNQEKLDKVVDQITGGRSESDRAEIPGFTEVEVDPAHMHIRLHWKGAVPASVAAVLAKLPAGISAEVVPPSTRRRNFTPPGTSSCRTGSRTTWRRR